jgi:hypothetical protein
VYDPAVGQRALPSATLTTSCAAILKPSCARARDGKSAQWKFLEEQAITGFDNDINMVAPF